MDPIANTPTATPASSPTPAAAPSATPTPAAKPAATAAPKPTGLDRLRQMKPAAESVAHPANDKVAGEPAKADKPASEAVSPPPGTTTTPPPGTTTVDPNKPVADPAPWTPNKKFKVMDKEHEIPDWIHEAAKTPEHEKQLRELHEKAYGLDIVKPRLAESQKQLKAMAPQLQRYEASKAELINHYRNGDLDSFFQTLDVPQEKVLQWAVKKAQLSQLPPEQRQAYEQQTEIQRRAATLEQQLQAANHQNATHSATIRENELQTVLAKPDVAAIATAYNKAFNDPMAFFNEIVAIGEATYNRDKTDLSPAQAVQMAVAKYKNLIQPAAPPAADPAPESAGQPGLIPPAPAPGVRAPNGQFATKPGSQTDATLPNVGARSGSPVGGGKQVRSIQDLRDRAKEMSARR